MSQKAERSYSISDADQHHALACQNFTAVSGNGGGARVEPASVDPNQNRDPVRRQLCRRPYIQVEAVLAHRRRLAGTRTLYTFRSELICAANAIPWDRGPRCPPAQLARGRSREWNATIDGETFFHCALQQTLLHLRRWIRSRAQARHRSDRDCQQNRLQHPVPFFTSTHPVWSGPRFYCSTGNR